MGGCTSDSNPNVIIDISYCGGCGWTDVVKNVCQSIKKQLPEAIMDCRPEQNFTGYIETSLVINKEKKIKIYKGDKQTTLNSIQKITKDVVNAYKNA